MGQAGGHNDGTAEHYSNSPFIQKFYVWKNKFTYDKCNFFADSFYHRGKCRIAFICSSDIPKAFIFEIISVLSSVLPSALPSSLAPFKAEASSCKAFSRILAISLIFSSALI